MDLMIFIIVVKLMALLCAVLVSRIRKTRNACSTLMGKPLRKYELWKQRERWEDDIKMYVTK